MIPILPPVFLTHCLLSSRYVNTITNKSPYAAHNISDGKNCGLGRARGTRIENQNPDPWFLKEQEKRKGSDKEREIERCTGWVPYSKLPVEDFEVLFSLTCQLRGHLEHGLSARGTFSFPSQPSLLLWPLKIKRLNSLFLRHSYSPGGGKSHLHEPWGIFSLLRHSVSIQGRKSLPENVHLGPAHFQEAESWVGSEITLLILGKRDANCPQAKQHASMPLILFCLSVQMGQSKGT